MSQILETFKNEDNKLQYAKPSNILPTPQQHSSAMCEVHFIFTQPQILNRWRKDFWFQYIFYGPDLRSSPNFI